ncbi:MAG TPA: primase C-terminal domain-containing protein [Bryobacteraceae bacterium]|nr:primase C-terminal domain-containing protein [Bryobacteraceae bacterium]
MNKPPTSRAGSPVEISIPDDLIERDQWVLWRYEERNGRATKVPYHAGRKRASSTDPRTWADFESVLSEWRSAPNWYAGLGFVFSPDDQFCGIDLDDSLDAEGSPKPWVRGIVERFSDTYMEISPSGMGLKIWVRGAVPANLAGVSVGDGQIEIYDHARYFAVTGRIFRGAPLEIEDHSADLRALYEHLTRPKKCPWPLQPLSGGRIPYGQQHSTLVSIAGTLRARRVCDEAIEACLQLINTQQCERPGPPENIARIVRSSRRWGAMV